MTTCAEHSNSERQFFDLPTAGKYARRSGLPITDRAVKYATIRGELPVYMVSNQRRWSSTDLDAWIEGMRVVGTARTSGGAA